MTPLIEALSTFVSRRVSALPVVDSDGQIVDVYTKHDVMVITANHSSHCFSYIIIIIIISC